jgi:SAM-dependent methyltransferase
MPKAYVTAAVLLALSIGMTRLHCAPGANLRPTAFAAIGMTTLAFLFFGHIELALAAMTPIALSFTATIGLFGWLGTRLETADIAAVLICLLPAMSLDIVQLDSMTREYRRKSRSTLLAMALLGATGIAAAASLCVLKQAIGRQSDVIQLRGLCGLVIGLVAVFLTLPPIARFLLPHDRKRLAPGFHLWGRASHVRALYRYLDISAEQYVSWKLRLDPIFARINQAVPSTATVFDAGCGFGIMTNLLSLESQTRHVVGIDLDVRKLRIARCAARTLRNVRYVTADLFEAEFPPADCVLLIDALHYWSAEKQSRLIARCAGCLRPGGVLIFREGMANDSAGHRLVHWAERAAVRLGHNPRGDGLCFQPREFYKREFASHGLEVQGERKDWGRGSNTVLILTHQQQRL